MPAATDLPFDPNAIFQQVLTAVNDLRVDVHDLNVRMDNVATKDDLKQYARMESLDGLRVANDFRFTEHATRLSRVEEKLDGLREDFHRSREYQQNADLHERKELDGRTMAILVTVLCMILSPIMYFLSSLLQHALFK